MTTERSGDYQQIKVIYFRETDDGKEFCHMWKLIEPSSETNSMVSYLKKNFVEVDYLTWKDYETELLYEIEVDKKFCVLTVWYDVMKRKKKI